MNKTSRTTGSSPTKTKQFLGDSSPDKDDNATLDKYIGTIFSRQIAGFKPEIVYAELQNNAAKSTMKNMNFVTFLAFFLFAKLLCRKIDDDHRKLPVQPNEFDPSIRFGRDSILYLKREVIDRLKRETRYNEEELKKLKDIYLKYAELGKGLNLARFKRFLSHLYNIESHPFALQLFTYFDKNEDYIVEFEEIIRSLNIIERGNFEEKVDFCFSIYDHRKKGHLDIFSLRELLKTSYVTVIVNLEKALKKIRAATTNNPRGFSWEEFVHLNVLETILDNLPIVYGTNRLVALALSDLLCLLDRMDYDKSMVDYLEKKFNFTLDGLEKFWNIYKKSVTVGTNSEARRQIAEEIGIKHPDMLSLNQFKLIMSDVFKVRNPAFLEELFLLADKNRSQFVDIQEFIGGLVFFFSGPFEIKFALFCEVLIKMDKELILPKAAIDKLLTDALMHFKEVFDSAKKISDAMNTNLDGRITFIEFRTFCQRFPSAMDFLGRITMGEYPTPDAKAGGLRDEEGKGFDEEGRAPSGGAPGRPTAGGDNSKTNFLSMDNYEDILKLGGKYNFEENEDSVTKRWVSRNIGKIH